MFVRVYYPKERGYRMEPELLPPWLYITITEDKDSKYLTVYSRVHMNKKVQMNPSYSTSFSDMEILKDLSGKIWEQFLQ